MAEASCSRMISQLQQLRCDADEVIRLLTNAKALSEDDVYEGDYFMENIQKSMKKIRQLAEANQAVKGAADTDDDDDATDDGEMFDSSFGEPSPPLVSNKSDQSQTEREEEFGESMKPCDQQNDPDDRLSTDFLDEVGLYCLPLYLMTCTQNKNEIIFDI